jgi:hypothetical protein
LDRGGIVETVWEKTQGVERRVMSVRWNWSCFLILTCQMKRIMIISIRII